MKESIIKAITAVICVIVLCITSSVAVGNYSDAVKEAAKLTGSRVNGGVSADVSTDEAVEESVDTPTDEPVDEIINEAVDNSTEDNTPTDPTDKADNKEETTQKADKQMSTAEIVELFNKSANKIKIDATKVVKNYEKRTTNEDKLQLPAGLESTAENMMKTFMKDDTDPIVYSTKDEIRAQYIVPEQSYVSRLQPSTVVKATCTDKGSTYEIYLKLKDQTNPTAGNGIGAVCDVIETHEVANKAPFVNSFDTSYYNCEIRATVDKASGKMLHTNYKTPLILNINVSLFGTHDLSIGFTFEKDYTITY